MKIGKTMFQSALFGDFLDIIPTTDRVVLLTDLYKDKNMIPTSYREFTPHLNVNYLNRIGFITENNEWKFNISSQRIDLFQNTLNLFGDNLDIQSFFNESIDIFSRFLSNFEKKGNRISFISCCFFEEENKNNYNDYYLNLRKRNGIYKDIVPFEWNMEDVIRKSINNDNYNEVFNINTKCYRFPEQFIFNDEFKPLDRINFIFDINSIPENLEYRYDSIQIKKGFDNIYEIYNSLISDL
jgi:hypothetical protein